MGKPPMKRGGKGKADGRRVLLRIAPAGETIIREVMPDSRKIYQDLESRFGREQHGPEPHGRHREKDGKRRRTAHGGNQGCAHTSADAIVETTKVVGPRGERDGNGHRNE